MTNRKQSLAMILLGVLIGRYFVPGARRLTLVLASVLIFSLGVLSGPWVEGFIRGLG